MTDRFTWTDVASGLRFPEGPVWMPDGSVILVEIERGTLSRVDLSDGSIDVVADCGGGPNGAALGPDGHIFVTNNGGFEWAEINGLLVPGHQPADYAGGSIQRVDPETGAVDTVYAEIGGRWLRGPNDLVFDDHGGFWFTDLGKSRPRERDVGSVYYAAADGSAIREVIHPLESPNGIGLSPDGATLYVADTRTGNLLSFDVEDPGRLAGDPEPSRARATVIHRAAGHSMFDSLAVDSAGRVCVGTLRPGGISVVAPDGSSAEVRPVDDVFATNICFGGSDGRTAFATLSTTGRLATTRWDEPGLLLHHTNGW